MTKLELIEEKLKKLPENVLDDVDRYVNALLDKEHDEWINMSAQSLSRAYSEDEPDYSDVLLKEPNPKYRG
jgi:hypothetical protein